jgi:hypothetical protein
LAVRLTDINPVAVKEVVAAAKLLAVIVVVNAPWTVAVVVEVFPLHVTEPPLATCAKLGCPPAAELDKPVHVILVGSVG